MGRHGTTHHEKRHETKDPNRPHHICAGTNREANNLDAKLYTNNQGNNPLHVFTGDPIKHGISCRLGESAKGTYKNHPAKQELVGHYVYIEKNGNNQWRQSQQ